MYQPESALAHLFDDPEKLTPEGPLETAPVYRSLASMAIYKRDISRIPISDPVEARQLAEFVRDGKLNAEVIEMLEFAEIPIEDEVLQIKNRAEAGKIAAELLVLRHLKLGAHTARLTMGWAPFGSTRYRSNGESVFKGARIKSLNQFALDRLPLEDRIQEASIGLLGAATRYRADGGAAFSTYAMYSLEQAIKRAVQNDGIIHIPIHIQEALAKVKAKPDSTRITHIDFLGSQGSDPRVQQEYLDQIKTVESLEHLEAESVEQASDYEELDDEWKPTFIETIEDHQREKSEFEEVGDALTNSRLERALNGLPERELLIIELRYGLDGDKPWTLETIGHELGLTRERVRQLEGQALSRLANALTYYVKPKEPANEPEQAADPEEPEILEEGVTAKLRGAAEAAQTNADKVKGKLDKILDEGGDNRWDYDHFRLGVDKKEALERMREYIAKMTFMHSMYNAHADYLEKNDDLSDLVQFNAITVDSQVETKLQVVLDDGRTRAKTKVWTMMQELVEDQYSERDFSYIFRHQVDFDKWLEGSIDFCLRQSIRPSANFI